MTDYYGYTYSAIIIIGGIIGYAKAGSLISLASGLIFGTSMGFMAMRISRNPSKTNLELALGMTLTLLIVMGYRFTKSGKFMPAGLVTILSLLMTFRYILCTFRSIQ